jgi:hypothetical protein
MSVEANGKEIAYKPSAIGLESTGFYGSQEADMLVEALGEDFHKLNDLMEPLRANISGVPNYPYKDDWHKLGLKQMLLEAIHRGGDADAISTSPAKVFSDRYSGEYEKFYTQLYDEKIPAEMQRLADNYGGKFEKGRLDVDNTFTQTDVYPIPKSEPLDELQANILRITPEMKQKILAEGLEAFAQGGLVQSIDIFGDY